MTPNPSSSVSRVAIQKAIQNGHGDKRRRLDQAGVLTLLSEQLPAKGQTRTVFDSEIPSFAVRLSPEGVATFLMAYSFGGKTRKFTIGRFRTADMAKRATERGLTATDARRKAVVLRSRIEQGEDIAADRSAAKEQAKAQEAAKANERATRQRKTTYTLKALLEAYVDHLRNAGKPSADAVGRAIERNISTPFPKLADKPADDVTVDDVMPVFHALAKAGKYREAEKLRAYLRAAYTAARKARTNATLHAFSGFGIRDNPLIDLAVDRPSEAPETVKERKWALTETQLAAYWKRIATLTDPHGALLRFHLLTGGQRVEQLARLMASDFDGSTITLLDTKGRRRTAYEHTVPLLPEAIEALDAMRKERRNKDGETVKPGPYLFTVSNGKFPAHYGTVREAVQEIATAMVKAKEIDRTFTPGILRKTVETRLQALGVSREVRAHLLSHGRSGVQARHYEAHEYDKEKRNALRRLRQLCEGKTGKVVPLKREAS